MRVYGAGGHSRVIQDVAALLGYTITVYFDDDPGVAHPSEGQVRPGIRLEPEAFPHAGDEIIIGVGDNAIRAELSRLIRGHYATLIHPGAVVSPTAHIGEGTVVYAGGKIQPNTRLGRHVIINTGASVDHDNRIGDYVHISPGAALTGHVEVGEGTHVGAAALVLPKVRIGKWCVIGAGTVVLKDVPDYAVVVGNPGKIIRYQNGE
ncbi:acetyltransferase [Robiginitalea sp. M366]|uniref:acetyltransferase n=1 Tax=Robiginitalea aestuariiviva TaxID=3036903 RepID=UPI00240D2503|nr:acetyltransferase [Robiginitalea aestuariiviva]MDG1572720.1 acetyltransferase [Robiginitalea aestuariiviva]